MKLQIKNFGPIKRGEIDLEKRFYVFVGYNSSGKTYASQLLWGMFEDEFLYEFLRYSKTTESIHFVYGQPFLITEKLVQQYFEEYQSYLKEKLLPKILRLKKDDISILNKLDLLLIEPDFSKLKAKEYGSSIVRKKKLDNTFTTFIIEKNKDSLKISISKPPESIFLFDDDDDDLESNFQNFAQFIIGRVIFTILFDSRIPFFLPSERTFFPAYNNYIQLAARRNQELISNYIGTKRNGELSNKALEILSSIPYSKATEQLVSAIENLSIANGGQKEYADLIQDLEQVLGGKITNELSKIEGITAKLEFGINLDQQDLKLPIELASSSINQLTTLYLYLKYWAKPKNNFLIIDEPEQNLHPKNQIILLNLLIEFANRNNNRVLINTHSPLLTDAINNHLHLGHLKTIIGEEETQKIIDENHINFNMESAMKPEDIGIYFFDGRSIQEYEVEDYGAFFRDFRKEEKEVERTANVLKNAIFDSKNQIKV